jgi:hypothetical protein
MNEIGDLYVNQNKPDSESQLSCFLSYVEFLRENVKVYKGSIREMEGVRGGVKGG